VGVPRRGARCQNVWGIQSTNSRRIPTIESGNEVAELRLALEKRPTEEHTVEPGRLFDIGLLDVAPANDALGICPRPVHQLLLWLFPGFTVPFADQARSAPSFPHRDANCRSR